MAICRNLGGYPVASAVREAYWQKRDTLWKSSEAGRRPPGKGPAEWFTGAVRIDPLFEAPDPARVVGASVTFEPGARTAWHTHPLGQTLIVTAGCGRAQRWGGPVEAIRPGDVIWFAPGEKHWHGATPTTAMTHLAIQEKLGGKDCRLVGAGERRGLSGWGLRIALLEFLDGQVKTARSFGRRRDQATSG